MEKTNNKNSQLHVRIDRDTMDVLEKKSKEKGLTMSSYIRYAIHKMDAEQGANLCDGGIKTMLMDKEFCQLLVNIIETNVMLFKEMLAELGKTGGNLNQAVRDMNTSLKAGSRSVSRQDVQKVESCSLLVSECTKEVRSGIVSLKQMVKKL